MARLEGVVTTADADGKAAAAARDSLQTSQEGLAREINELIDSMSKS